MTSKLRHLAIWLLLILFSVAIYGLIILWRYEHKQIVKEAETSLKEAEYPYPSTLDWKDDPNFSDVPEDAQGK